MSAVEIAGGVHWIGALDPALRSFDIILTTANGTTYNSYVVRGTSGIAVIDTVKEEFSDTFFANLEEVAAYDEITAIVLNHLEPDHTGALPELLRRAPRAKVYISCQAPGMLKALLKPGDDEAFEYTPMDTGDSLDLGNRRLAFLNTPFLHWPDTQCTWLADEGVLFPGDLFGCHFCDDRLFNDLVGDFRFSFEYYHEHIMRPFKDFILEALDLIEPLAPRLVAPAHGPILRDRPMSYIRRYRELSTPRLNSELGQEKSLLVFYISAYGSTTRMAEEIARGAEGVDGVRVSLYDLQGGDVSPFVNLIEETDGLVLGSPTINGDAARPIWDLLASLHTIKIQGKLGAAFGSYGWTGEAVEMIEARMRGLKMRVPEGGMRIKLIPTDEELADCRAFGRTIALNLVGRRERKVIDFAALG